MVVGTAEESVGAVASEVPIVASAWAAGATASSASIHATTTDLLIVTTLVHMLGVVFDPDPLPFIALMGLGFFIGVTGHVYKSRTAVATGIGMIFVATLLLPLGLYLNDR
jgi:hypothetical protein